MHASSYCRTKNVGDDDGERVVDGEGLLLPSSLRAALLAAPSIIILVVTHDLESRYRRSSNLRNLLRRILYPAGAVATPHPFSRPRVVWKSGILVGFPLVAWMCPFINIIILHTYCTSSVPPSRLFTIRFVLQGSKACDERWYARRRRLTTGTAQLIQTNKNVFQATGKRYKQ